jgi:hypothetical protein
VTLRLTASAVTSASPQRVWAELTDWAGQSRWIPFTSVRVGRSTTGLGVRAAALSGFRVGRLPLGLLDHFVVTGWTPPDDGPGHLEVLHLGPFFTGPGEFTVRAVEGGTRVECVEAVDLAGGRLTETLARLLVPLLSRGFAHSLRRLAAISETP